MAGRSDYDRAVMQIATGYKAHLLNGGCADGTWDQDECRPVRT